MRRTIRRRTGHLVMKTVDRPVSKLLFVKGGIPERTASSEGREPRVFLHAGMPPKAGYRGHESCAKVESEEAGVTESREDDRDGKVVGNTIEEQVADVSL